LRKKKIKKKKSFCHWKRKIKKEGRKRGWEKKKPSISGLGGDERGGHRQEKKTEKSDRVKPRKRWGRKKKDWEKAMDKFLQRMKRV